MLRLIRNWRKNRSERLLKKAREAFSQGNFDGVYHYIALSRGFDVRERDVKIGYMFASLQTGLSESTLLRRTLKISEGDPRNQ